jgi:hypothetical protein
MDGRDGQTWTASAMTILRPGASQAPPTPPATQRAKPDDKAA